jgi:hypothetical protein
MRGMTDKEADEFLERISATTIANQAVLKLIVSGLPVTSDGAIRLIGDFIDPTRPELSRLIEKISNAIDEVVECRDKLSSFWPLNS